MINSLPTYMCVIQHDSLIGCFNTLSNREPFCSVLWILWRLILVEEWHLSFFSFSGRNARLGEFVEKNLLFPFAFTSKSGLSTGLRVLLTVPQQWFGLWSSGSCWDLPAKPRAEQQELVYSPACRKSYQLIPPTALCLVLGSKPELLTVIAVDISQQIMTLLRGPCFKMHNKVVGCGRGTRALHHCYYESAEPKIAVNFALSESCTDISLWTSNIFWPILKIGGRVMLLKMSFRKKIIYCAATVILDVFDC